MGRIFRIAEIQVVQDGRGYDGNNDRAKVKADSLFIQIAHHAGGRVQAERTAAREHHPVDLLHGVDRIQQVGLSRARSAAAHIHSGYRSLFTQNHGAAGRPARFGEVADLDAFDIGEAAARSSRASRIGKAGRAAWRIRLAGSARVSGARKQRASSGQNIAREIASGHRCLHFLHSLYFLDFVQSVTHIPPRMPAAPRCATDARTPPRRGAMMVTARATINPVKMPIAGGEK